jgi:phosphatidylserine/phosphatidylglycerophosphate/cardiolipin synthase-like enzyme
VARAYAKAFGNARSLIYIEDQYMWSKDVAEHLAAALRRSPDLRLIAVVPRYPDRDGLLSGPPQRVGQIEAIQIVRRAGGDRVAVYDLENERGRPIYVHAKACVVDDVWAAIGSDNLNRRSWTHDSEISCAVIDGTVDEREPSDLTGAGEGARVFARELRLALWREHLGTGTDESLLLDPVSGFDVWRQIAGALDEWHRTRRSGPRPEGRARAHEPQPVSILARAWAGAFYRLVVDPDGRPPHLKRAHRF